MQSTSAAGINKNQKQQDAMATARWHKRVKINLIRTEEVSDGQARSDEIHGRTGN